MMSSRSAWPQRSELSADALDKVIGHAVQYRVTVVQAKKTTCPVLLQCRSNLSHVVVRRTTDSRDVGVVGHCPPTVSNDTEVACAHCWLARWHYWSLVGPTIGRLRVRGLLK